MKINTINYLKWRNLLNKSFWRYSFNYDRYESAGGSVEWRTSAADTKIRIWLFIGKIIRLSTSNNRKELLFISL
jgi:hypothetical protein